jgi:hypothetical protein
MNSPRAERRSVRIPVIGVIGLLASALIGLIRFRPRSKQRRPTGADVMRMSEPEFAAFVRETGVLTVTSARLLADGHAD